MFLFLLNKNFNVSVCLRRFYIFIIPNAASRLQTVIITHTYFQRNLLPAMARNHYFFSLVHFRDGLCKVIFSQMKCVAFCATPTVKFPQLFALNNNHQLSRKFVLIMISLCCYISTVFVFVW